MERVLLDTSFLYALFSSSDINHSRVVTLAEKETAEAIIPDVVLPEVKFLFRSAGSLFTAMEFMDALTASQATVEKLTKPDIERANELSRLHRQQQISFTQCSIVALAERFNIKTVYTLEPTPFKIIQPAHSLALQILPE